MDKLVVVSENPMTFCWGNKEPAQTSQCSEGGDSIPIQTTMKSMGQFIQEMVVSNNSTKKPGNYLQPPCNCPKPSAAVAVHCQAKKQVGDIYRWWMSIGGHRVLIDVAIAIDIACAILCHFKKVLLN